MRIPLRSPIAILFVLSTAGALVGPRSATGQVPDSTVAGDTLAEAPIRLAPVTVTAARVPVRTDRVGFALSVIEPELLEPGRRLYAVDALRDLPAAFVDEANGPGGPTIVRLRGGEEVFTQIMVDGIKINQNGGFFDFQGLALNNVGRVEVARGPQSALYGSSAVSGVVNILTPRGQAGPTRLTLAAEGATAAGDGGSYRVGGTASGGNERATFSGGLGTAFNRGIYEVPNDTRTYDASLRADVTPSAAFDLTGTVRVAMIESGLPVRDPGVTRVPLDPNARTERDRLVTTVQGRYAHPSGLTHQIRGSAYRELFVYDDQRDDVAGTTEFEGFVFDADFRLEDVLWRATVEYLGTYAVRPRGPGTRVSLSYGSQWEREDLHDQTSGEFGDGQQRFARDAVSGFAEVLVEGSTGFGVTAGARIEKYEGLDAELVPRASAAWSLVPGRLTVKAAAGRAFKAPNLQEQFLDNPFIRSNPDLAAETSTSWEVGGEVRSEGGGTRLQITYFQQDFDNLIRSVALEGTNQQINRNLGKSEARGMEWSARFRLDPQVLLGTDGSWASTEVVDNSGLSAEGFPEGEELPFRPDWVWNAFIEVEPTSGLVVEARGSRVGSQTVLTERFSGDRVEIDPYVLVELAGRYRVSPTWQLRARIQNLLDTSYETGFDRPGFPFTASVGVRVER